MRESLAIASVVGLAVGLASAAFAAPFTPGNLVVVQLNPDGAAAAPTSAAAPVFLKEFSLTGTQVQAIALQATAAASGNRALTMAGNATAEGMMTLSSDGRFLTLSGYNADAGTLTIASSASGTVNRVVGRVDCDGNVDTTTAFDAFNGGPARTAVTVDGSAFWVTGNAGTGQGTTSGIQYVLFGAPAAPVGLITAPTNNRFLNIFNGQLYLGTGSPTGGFFGVSTIGTGLPTTGPVTPTLLPGFPGATNPAGYSPYDFYLADANTLYVADDGAAATRGIQKWTFNAGIWTLAYSLNTGLTNSQIRHLTGVTVAGVTTLYATTGETTANRLVTVTDTGATSAFTVLATAPANTVFRGVDFAPTCPPPPSCYANCDGSTNAPVLNALDFACFLTRYVAGEAYANCDASTNPPVLNALDFGCFLNRYVAGCR